MGKGGRSDPPLAAAAAAAAASDDEQVKPVWSSGVPFFPPSSRYWRIGGEWYDLEPFLDKHPGGAEIVRLSRDRFEDCTHVFESHHHDYKRARAVLAKYKVPTEVALATVRYRPAKPPQYQLNGRDGPTVHGAQLDADTHPTLLGDGAFYSVMRKRLSDHLRAVHCREGGPTTGCCVLFWATFAGWVGSWIITYMTGSFLAAFSLGCFASWLGAFGHNWVHQPRYKLWAYLSLDTVGFSSDGWYREHLLQHHMYTNTPWDNHFLGTDPFLVVDPTVPRVWWQRSITPFINPLLLTLGLYANYTAHLIETFAGHESWRPTKLLLPLQIGLMLQAWGWRGALLVYIANSVLGIYYFSLALMNHNGEHTHDVDARNGARDWGEAQLCASCDWAVHLPFYRAGIYLWLNFHTVHHLFPRLDFSHHPAAQRILLDTCQEFGVKYTTGTFVQIYKEMIQSFRDPHSLAKEIMVYGAL